jgi:Mrp family chromosome partitioning ATPase/capsular polysaccharide biosynthesis protein
MNETTDATAIFAPLWKRKWLILLVGILVAVATYLYYDQQTPEYGASTGIYLGGGSEVQELLGNENSAESDRSISNQVVLINSSLVGEAVLRRLTKEGNAAATRGSATATAAEGSDFISISAYADTGAGAADLANAYAEEYLRLRQAAYKRNVNAALTSTQEQLDSVSSEEGGESVLVQDLVERVNQLRSQLSLADTGDEQINPAVPSATALSPKPKRNAIFGFVLGLVLAGVAAYALSRFDRRLRSLADIERAFSAPLLAAVPSIKRPIGFFDGRPSPAPGLREPLRRLHTTLQLNSAPDAINQQPSPRLVLFTSADAGDGKSTLVAGLALAQAEAGERVAIVESDLRRPVQARLMGVDGSRGLAEVLAGALTVRDAIQQVVVPGPGGNEASAQLASGLTTAVEPRLMGSVSVLPSGGTVSNPPALLAGRTMPMLLHSLAGEYDYVLIDAPPPLEVSDVLPVLAMVDAIVTVARVGHTGETSAQRLVDLFSRSPHAPVVGTIANDASAADMEAFGFSAAEYSQGGWRL